MSENRAATFQECPLSSITRKMKGARTLAIVVALCPLSIIPMLAVTFLKVFSIYINWTTGKEQKKSYVKNNAEVTGIQNINWKLTSTLLR